MCPVSKVDRIIVRRSIHRIRKTAVDRTDCAARDRDTILRTVAAPVGESRRARAARMTTVDVCIAAVYDNRIVMRRIARFGNAAVDIRPVKHGRCNPGKLPAFVADVSDLIAGLMDRDVLLRRCIRLGLECAARIAREVYAVRVPDERHTAADGAAHRVDRALVERRHRTARKVQHHCACSDVRCIEFDFLEARDVLCSVCPPDVQRVARSIRRRTARDCPADDRTAFEADGVVTRCHARASRYRADRGIDDADHVPRCHARGCAARNIARVRPNGDDVARCFSFSRTADDVRRKVFLNGDGVARRLASRCIRIAAVDRAAYGCTAADCDAVSRAVTAPLCCSRRTCPRRPAAVHIRVRAAIDRDRVPRRRVACTRASAPRVCAKGRRCRHIPKPIGITDNVRLLPTGFKNFNICFFGIIVTQRGREFTVMRKVQSRRIMYKRDGVLRRCEISLDRIKVEVRSYLCQRQLGGRVLENDCREILNSTDRRSRVDIQRIARGSSVSTVKLRDCRAGGKRMCPVAEVDRIIVRRSVHCIRKTAVNRTDCAARDRDSVLRAVTAPLCCSHRACARRPAAVHIRVRAAVDCDRVLRRRVADRGASAPCVRSFGLSDRRALEDPPRIAKVLLCAVQTERHLCSIACYCCGRYAVLDFDFAAFLLNQRPRLRLR